MRSAASRPVLPMLFKRPFSMPAPIFSLNNSNAAVPVALVNAVKKLSCSALTSAYFSLKVPIPITPNPMGLNAAMDVGNDFAPSTNATANDLALLPDSHKSIKSLPSE